MYHLFPYLVSAFGVSSINNSILWSYLDITLLFSSYVYLIFYSLSCFLTPNKDITIPSFIISFSFSWKDYLIIYSLFLDLVINSLFTPYILDSSVKHFFCNLKADPRDVCPRLQELIFSQLQV